MIYVSISVFPNVHNMIIHKNIITIRLKISIWIAMTNLFLIPDRGVGSSVCQLQNQASLIAVLQLDFVL